MKIGIAQQNYRVGDFKHNVQKIVEAIERAKKNGIELLVFSELSICSYPPRDFLYFNDFINKCEQAIVEVAKNTIGIAVIVGAPSRNSQIAGKDLYNTAYFINEGKVEQIIHKTCLPTYDVFDEDRYFEAATDWQVIHFKNKRIALTICEDIWNLGDNPLYVNCPMDELMKQYPDFMINISASPFDYTHDEDRKATVKSNVVKYGLPMFYCNAIGSQTEVVFDGTSLIFDKQANLVGRLASFAEDEKYFTLNVDGSIEGSILEKAAAIFAEQLNPEFYAPNLHTDQIYEALLLGIKDYFNKMGFKKAIIGSSGGIDSAVTLALACQALGSENVSAILMPSEFSSDHSIKDAISLSENLKNAYEFIPIKELYQQFLKDLKPLFKDLPFGVAEENIQSRTRGNLLMAIANKFGYILLNTSNKSELSTGYGTLYGDMAGGLSVLGDCYKLQVYALAKYINRNKEIIPENIITKPPSAELKPDQKDSDSLPDYEILDAILYQYIEKTKGPDEIKNLGFDEKLTDRILSMVNKNEYKRNQFCPIIRVSPKAFGVGRRLPIVATYLS